jgi:hypothetical protein
MRPRNKVGFAWWGEAWAGLIDSTHHGHGLASADRDPIALYLLRITRRSDIEGRVPG